MRRARFAVLVLPYAVERDGEVAYALFRGAAKYEGAWHPLSGDGMPGETPLQAAQREAWRLAGVPADAAYLALDSRATIDVHDAPSGLAEHAFAVRVLPDELRRSGPLLDHCWVCYEVADGLLHREADRNALWELRRRLGQPAPCR